MKLSPCATLLLTKPTCENITPSHHQWSKPPRASFWYLRNRTQLSLWLQWSKSAECAHAILKQIWNRSITKFFRERSKLSWRFKLSTVMHHTTAFFILTLMIRHRRGFNSLLYNPEWHNTQSGGLSWQISPVWAQKTNHSMMWLNSQFSSIFSIYTNSDVHCSFCCLDEYHPAFLYLLFMVSHTSFCAHLTSALAEQCMNPSFRLKYNQVIP